MTETAALADVVFPAASFAETDGCYTNVTGRWQAVRAAKRPPAEARPDWWIVVELARRMVSEKQRKAWEFSGPASVLDEIAKILGNNLAHYRGLDYDAMDSGGKQRPQPQRVVRRSFLRVDPDHSGMGVDLAPFTRSRSRNLGGDEVHAQNLVSGIRGRTRPAYVSGGLDEGLRFSDGAHRC